MTLLDLLEELKQVKAACEPVVLVRLPLEVLERFEIISEEIVNTALEVRLRVRAGNRSWHQPWARAKREGLRAAELLEELETKS